MPKSRGTFNAKAVIAQAQAGDLPLAEIRQSIRTAENFGNREAVSTLRGI